MDTFSLDFLSLVLDTHWGWKEWEELRVFAKLKKERGAGKERSVGLEMPRSAPKGEAMDTE